MTKLAPWIRELRLHQWTKNLLLAVPAIASFTFFEPGVVSQLILSFISFSLIASASYIFNDYIDLKNDRIHEIKKNRPLASGQVSTPVALLSSALLLLTGLALGFLAGSEFFLILLTYLVMTALYSLWLKRVTLIDCLMLAGLYTLRIIAGGAATDIEPSFWLLTFSIFFFLSVAWVKRYAELESARSQGLEVAPGRGYAVTDMPVILTFGSAAAGMAVLVSALYLDSAAIRNFYESPEVAWLAIPFLMYLIGRLWFKAHRGQMNQDPILFLVKDLPSLLAVMVSAGILVLAHIGWPV
jgi:4-hydroxybenzoate polyprenyltransferase